MYKLIVAIVPDNYGDTVSAAAKSAGATGGTIVPGYGTASSSVLSLLGLGDSSKEFVLTVVSEEIEYAVQEAIQEACEKKKHFGVIFSVDVNCLIRSGHKSNFSIEEKGGSKMNSYQMIYIIVNKGYAEDAMAAARKAGAGGGTIIHGRGTAKEGDAKFFGVEIVPEKEVLIILSPNEKAAAVVDAVQNLDCFSTSGSGIIFCADANNFSLLGKRQ